MERHFDSELSKLKDRILAMGGLVESAIGIAVEALLDRKPENFSKVFEVERQINQAHMEVDEACVRLLARHSPLAADLRMIVAVLKINTDLERMGDQAVNIAHNGALYLKEAPLKPLIDIPRMAKEAQVMLREALDSFVRRDVALAHAVLKRDDSVDALKNQIFRELITYMIADPKTIERALDLILIARNLERVGDHATNVAEDVIFAITGDDIRHGKRAAT